jgi:hypothetical protein
MSDKVWFARAGDFLVATDEQSLKCIRKLGEGEAVPFKPLRPRSLKWHKRYWAMLSDLWPHVTEINISLGPKPAMMPINSAEDLHTALKLISGHCITQHIKDTPYVLRIPLPTDFASLSADEWEKLYPRLVNAIHERAIPEIRVPEIAFEMARLAS